MSGKTTTVGNTAQLNAVLRTARAGDTVLLKSGNYGDVSLWGVNPNGVVTIKSANPDADAVFKTLKVNSSSNLVFSDIDITNPSAGQHGTAAVTVLRASNVTLAGLDINGSLDGNAANDSNGITILDSNRVSVLDTNIRQAFVGVLVARSENIQASGNTITEAREGINIAQLKGGIFDRNHFTDFQPDLVRGDHADFFQVHAGGNFGASSDIVFRNNVLIQGTSTALGGIFVQSEKVAQGFRHKNILIENNYYEGSYGHGISVSNTDNVRITGNTVIDSDAPGWSTGIILSNVNDVLVDKNIAGLLQQRNDRGASTDVVWRDNIDVWDRQTKKGVALSSLFEGGRAGDIELDALIPIAGRAAATGGIGFRAVADIGDLSGSVGQQLATYLPAFDHNPAAVMLV